MEKAVSRLVMPGKVIRNLVAIICAIALVPGDSSVLASQAPSAAPAAQGAVKLPDEQLDSLVAPIALYPDPLLSQTLVASTYPLEVIQLQQWLSKNKDLKGDALTKAVQEQDWDPSIQALASLPEVVKQLAENIKWTTDLGNAFLAQQNDLMNAVQRMRMKAKNAGNLKSTEQQKVETKVVESKTVVVIQPASPEVVYVPSYNPVVVYGPPAYPYPPITYPPPGYYAAGMAISFGIGMAMGAAWGGGSGWGCGWGGHNNVYINNNNNFVKNSNTRQNISNRPVSGNSNWQHNPQHRGGAPYSDRATARQYGGTTRGDSLATRQASARQTQTQRGTRQQASLGDRGSGFGGRQPGAGDQSPRSRDAGGRGAGAGAGSFGADRGGGGGGDRVGNRSVGSGGSSRGSSAFGGGGFNGGSARTSSTRGSRSMGGGSGGGRRR